MFHYLEIFEREKILMMTLLDNKLQYSPWWYLDLEAMISDFKAQCVMLSDYFNFVV